MDLYTGVRVHTVKKEIIDDIYRNKEVELFDNRYNWPQNLYVVLKDETGGQSSALGRVKGNRICLLQDSIEVSGVRARNKEQRMALDALTDDNLNVVVLTGRAGTGKTLLTLATALNKIEEKKYKRVVLTRPMSQVGKWDLGILPGEIENKFGPYLENYLCNLEFIMGGRRDRIQDLIAQHAFEFVPLQLIRGASWSNTFIIADEVQTLDYHEMTTLGTRVGEGSKLVIMGDLAQRDERITRDKTGIHKFVNHPLSQASDFVASIELIKCERSKTAALFADVFEAK